MKIKNSVRTIWPSNGQLINNTPLENEWGITVKTSPDESEVNYTVLAERFLDTYATSCLPSTQQPDTAYNATLLKQDLEFLSNKLESVRKTITSWDAYHISQVVTTEEELQTGLSSLMENSSLLVNIPSSTRIGDRTYAMGDIVYCDLNRNQHIINSLPNGFYYPSSIKTEPNSNNITLQWNYSITTPIDNSGSSENDLPILDRTTLSTPYYKIGANLPYREEQILYGLHNLLEPGADISYEVEHDILPEIYFYAVGDTESSYGERYYLPSSAIAVQSTENSKSIIVKNLTNIPLWVFVR